MGEDVDRKESIGGGKSFSCYNVLATAVLFLAACGSAAAFEIPTGNEDVKLRWDNTFRYTLSGRVSPIDRAIVGNPNNDDGDRHFDKGIVSNRLDLLSEADIVYRNDYGIRVSGAGWYDEQYRNSRLDWPNDATSNHIVYGKQATGLNSYVDKYYAGPNGELLDAFAFGKVTFGDMPLNMKAGRHTVFWGEGLGLAGTVHGVSYAQSPLDIGKGLAMPGAEAKELFRPLNQVSFQLQPTSTLTFAGQYFLEWESNKFAEAGTYLGMYDMMMNGGESYILGPGKRLLRGADPKPKDHGDWGLSTRWTPEWLEGTIGLYYRNFSDKFAQLHASPAATVLPVAVGGALGYTQLTPASPSGTATYHINPSAASIPAIKIGNVGQYHLAYADNIDLYGLSISRQILGVSVGAELSYRHNMPLLSDAVYILPSPLANPVKGQLSALPGDGGTGGARGNTWHSVVNFLGTIGRTPVFDAASWNMEYVWSHLDRVTSGGALYKGRDSYNAIDKPTKDYIGGAISFTSTWYQVFPGVDLTMPLNISSGLVGNSQVTMGGNKNGGSYSIGIGADFFNKYKADLKYVDFFGQYGTDPKTGAVTVANGANALLSDRGMLTLSVKATF